MRVEAELLDHPKFFRLERKLGEPAIKVLLRIWGHCQASQRGERWPGADPEYVEAVARWTGPEGACYAALVDCGFLDVVEGGVVVHDWESFNNRTVAAWRGGAVRRLHAAANRQPKLPVKREVHPALPPEGNPTPEPEADRELNREDKQQGKVYEGMSEGMSEREEALSPSPLSSFVESPSLDEVLAYLGQMAAGAGNLTGAPAVDPDWARDWWEWRRNNVTGGFESMRDWRLVLARDWRRQWPKWEKRKADATEKGQWEAQAQIRQLEAILREHPGNPDNSVGSLSRKERERPAFDQLKRQLLELRKQVVAA